MPVYIDNDDMPDILRGLRRLIEIEQKDADAHQGESTWPQLQNGVRHLEAKLRKYEEAYRRAKS